MKTRISHLNGEYQSDTAADLCEVFCEPEGETYRNYLKQVGFQPKMASGISQGHRELK